MTAFEALQSHLNGAFNAGDDHELMAVYTSLARGALVRMERECEQARREIEGLEARVKAGAR